MLPPHHPCIRAVIFDLDDTLIDWSGQSVKWADYFYPKNKAMYDYLAAAGYTLPITADAFSARIRAILENEWAEAKKSWRGASFVQVMRILCQELGVDPEQVNMTELLTAHNWGPFPGVQLFVDTLTVLDTLRWQGYRPGLITNSHLPMWMRDVELAHYGLLDYFPARITSGDTGYMKPHPAIFQHMAQLLDVRPEQAVFVGDRPANDIAGANQSGMISVWLNLPHLHHQLEEVEPDFVITQLSQLPAVLAELNQSASP